MLIVPANANTIPIIAPKMLWIVASNCKTQGVGRERNYFAGDRRFYQPRNDFTNGGTNRTAYFAIFDLARSFARGRRRNAGNL